MGRHYHRNRNDKNHKQVTDELRDAGLSCSSTSSAGNGFPDVVVGAPGLTIVGDPHAVGRVLAALQQAVEAGTLPPVVLHSGANLIVELKTGKTGDLKTKSRTRERQERWAAAWRGQSAKCLSVEEVFALVGRQRPSQPSKDDSPECPSSQQLPPCPNAPSTRRRGRRVR